jgi:hypothetical protein
MGAFVRCVLLGPWNLYIRVFYVLVFASRKFDYHLPMVDIKLSIEAHKFHSDSHNSSHGQYTTVPIPQTYLVAVKTDMYKFLHAKTAKWRSYRDCSFRRLTPTRTRN